MGWIPWRQNVGKLPDPAAAVPLSDYRSEQLHVVELARSTAPPANTHESMQHKDQVKRSLNTQITRHEGLIGDGYQTDGGQYRREEQHLPADI